MCRRSGDRLYNCLLHNNGGFHALSIGDIPAAGAHLEATAEAAQQIGWESPELRGNLGLMLRAEGDRDGAASLFSASLRISRRNGDSRGMGYACLYLACVDSNLGDWARAGELQGCAQVFQDRAGIPWDDFDGRYRKDSLARTRAGLGEEQLDEAYARGMARSLVEALDLALSAPAVAARGAAGACCRSESGRSWCCWPRGRPTPRSPFGCCCPVNTVRSHLERIRDKTGARRRPELVRYAIAAGIDPVAPVS